MRRLFLTISLTTIALGMLAQDITVMPTDSMSPRRSTKALVQVMPRRTDYKSLSFRWVVVGLCADAAFLFKKV